MTVPHPVVAAVGTDVLHHRTAGTARTETVRMVVTSLTLRHRRNDGGIDHPQRRITTGRISDTGRVNRNGIYTTEGAILLLLEGFREVPVQWAAIAGDVRQRLQSHDLVRTITVLRRIEVGVGLGQGIDREVPDDRRPIGDIRAEVGPDLLRICRRVKNSISRIKSPTLASLRN